MRTGSATPTVWWRRHWPTTEGGSVSLGQVDTDKVEMIEAALEALARRRLPRAGAPARHPVQRAPLRQRARTTPRPGR